MGLDATAFSAELEIIDGNPFVRVPPEVLSEVFRDAGRSKSPIPVRGTITAAPTNRRWSSSVARGGCM